MRFAIIPRFWKTALLLAACAAASTLMLTAQPSGSPVPVTPAGKQSESTLAFQKAVQLMATGDLDQAIAKATEAIQDDGQNMKNYILRGSLYSEKKQWSLAEQDFRAARKLDPKNNIAQFDLAEIKLMQKDYADALTGFQGMVTDPELGDLASYKVFLCDLYGGHQEDAARELGIFDKMEGGASYYYANLAWALYHSKTDEARSWLDSATRIFPAQENHNYASTLKEFGYLPLPAP